MIDRDNIIRMAREALEAETSESWEGNSYHPKIHSAITALHQALEAEQPPRQPLTDGEVKMLIPDGDEWKYEVGFAEATEFARAIERAHGITGETK